MKSFVALILYNPDFDKSAPILCNITFMYQDFS